MPKLQLILVVRTFVSVTLTLLFTPDLVIVHVSRVRLLRLSAVEPLVARHVPAKVVLLIRVFTHVRRPLRGGGESLAALWIGAHVNQMPATRVREPVPFQL